LIILGNGYVEGMQKIFDNLGLSLERVDYNEPGRGKDDCDRQAAVAKKFINSYLNEGHDVVTADDIKNGILWRGGPRNTSVAVGSISKLNTKLEGTQGIPGILSYHSVEIFSNYFKFFKYYKIGTGTKILIKPVNFVSGMVLHSAFTKTKILDNTIHGRISKLEKNDFELLEQPATTKDLIINIYKSSLIESAVDKVPDDLFPDEINIQTSVEAKLFFKEGWALPLNKKKRISKEVKSFLKDLFANGMKTGIKVTPEKAFTKMREARNSDGSKRFNVQDYILPSPIKSIFSQMTKDSKKIEEVQIVIDYLKYSLVFLMIFLIYRKV
jgi:hypothetical protein